MTALRPRLRALVVGAAAVALVTIGAGGTLAASTTPTVYACFNVNGQVAMATIAQCKLAGGGQLVQINAQGIQGPTGPQGPTGAMGPTGPGGTPYRWRGSAPIEGALLRPTYAVDVVCGAHPAFGIVDYTGLSTAHLWSADGQSTPTGDLATIQVPAGTTLVVFGSLGTESSMRSIQGVMTAGPVGPSQLCTWDVTIQNAN